jgi:hypothetical protein
MDLAFRNKLNPVFSKLKLLKPSTRLVLGFLAVLIPVMLFAIVYFARPNQFWPNAPFYISCFAVIFAGISALVALRSLEMTRNTIRPFLSWQSGEMSFEKMASGGLVALAFHVKNSGPVPAKLVTAETAFFDADEVIEDNNESKHYPKEREQPKNTLIFPDTVYNVVQYFDLSRAIDKKLFDNMIDGKVVIRFCIIYSAQGREYVTVQTEKLGKAERGLMNRAPIQPQKWT